jgi:hypothetical protein
MVETVDTTAAAEGSAWAFERFGGACALLAGLVNLCYAVTFVLLDNKAGSALSLLLAGLVGVPVLVALYGRLRPTEPGAALCALVLGVGGAFGAAAHGGYDLANALHPPRAGLATLPNAVDPRGLATFGLTGLAVLGVAWLIRRGGRLPAGLGALGYLLGVLLLALWLGRLIVLEATSPVIAVPALLAGFVVGPAWYLWLGRVLLTGTPAGRP